MRQVDSAITTAATAGRSALRSLASDFRDRVVGAAFANLRLSMTLLLTGVGFLVALIAAPVLIVVFAMTVGVSHGLLLDVPAEAGAAPPLPPRELASPLPG